MEPNVTPEPILELVTGCMAAQYVMVGTELGLFEQLGKDAHTAGCSEGTSTASTRPVTWLSGSGWEFRGDRPLNGPASLIEADARS